MGLLSSEHTTPVDPKRDPVVMEKGREVEAARAVLSAIEARARELEAERDAPSTLPVLPKRHTRKWLKIIQTRSMPSKEGNVSAREWHAFGVSPLPKL